jgi:phenylalanyl-tRNA synthetase beta chain
MPALLNPMVEDHTHLRTTLLPGLLNAARANTNRGVADIRLFELGRTFHGVDGEIDERRRLAILMTGATQDGTWNLPPEAVTIGFYHLKGVVEALLRELHVEGWTISPDRLPWLHPGRTARLSINGHVVGSLGELHPDVAAHYDLPAGVYLADLDMEAFLEYAQLTPRFTPVPRYPAVRRDVALLLARPVPSSEVVAVIRSAGGALLEEVRLFDVYEGAPVPAGERSLAFALTFRSPDRTLAADEVEARLTAIRDALRARLRAKIRE